MNEFTKEELRNYLRIRRNAINEIINMRPIPGIIDTLEKDKMKAILDEFTFMEAWFNE